MRHVVRDVDAILTSQDSLSPDDLPSALAVRAVLGIELH